ncbi:MAG: flavin-containing monooxygenase [Pseudomonadales bacterium]
MGMQYYDVIIVGAGLSGIGAAYHLQRQCPGKTFSILEGRDAIGGTWDLFRYPGIRSDSDMYTLGYEFKPWHGGKVLADGPSIRRYVEETAKDSHIIEHIQFNQMVQRADWDSASATWTVTTEQKDGSILQHQANMLLLCAGYYNYESGYEPDFPGKENFKGEYVRPQHWPESLDYKDKRVVVIGSGATAVTIVPSMAEDVEHITMLQRSPTYMANRPQIDRWEQVLGKVLPRKTLYSFIRWKNATMQRMLYGATRRWPGAIKKMFLKQVRKQLPDYDVDTHFTPSYNPWDQRLCAVPENDIFEAIKSGKADVVTDHIDHFTESGIKLKSGTELPADIVVAATGLQLVVNGKIKFTRDGEAVDFADTWSYHGTMFTGVPNAVATFGYINASWTLRADLIANFFCGLMNHMQSKGANTVEPKLRDSDRDMTAKQWIEDFPSGYMARSMHLFPKQGDRTPWINTQNYTYEKRVIGKANYDDGVLTYSTAKTDQNAAA